MPWSKIKLNTNSPTFSFHTFLQQKNTFIIITAALLFMHVLYLGKGGLYFPDESRYLTSFNVIEDLVYFQGNKVEKIAQDIFNQNTSFDTSARPGDVIIRLIPASIQFWVRNHFNVGYNTVTGLWIPQLFNLFFVFLIAQSIFKIIKIESKSTLLAQIATIIYLLVPSSFFYTRHIISYDIALGLFMWILTQLYITHRTNQSLSITKALLIGILNVFALSIYPGYILFFVLNNALLVLYPIKQLNTKHLLNLLLFFLGQFTLFYFYQQLAQLNHVNYLSYFTHTPIGITQGDFAESFSFIIKFLYRSLNISGLLLLILVAIYLIKRIAAFANPIQGILNKENTLVIILLGFIASWLFYAVQAYRGEFVFYGRLIHMYVPIILIVGILSFYTIAPKKYHFLGLVVICICSLFTVIALFSVQYPRDILSKYQASLGNVSYVDEYSSNLSINTPPFNPYLTAAHSTNPIGDYVIVNSCYFLPNANDMAINFDFQNYELIYSFDHPSANYLYLLEGYTIKQREQLLNLHPQIKIYKNKSIQ